MCSEIVKTRGRSHDSPRRRERDSLSKPEKRFTQIPFSKWTLPSQSDTKRLFSGPGQMFNKSLGSQRSTNHGAPNTGGTLPFSFWGSMSICGGALLVRECVSRVVGPLVPPLFSAGFGGGGLVWCTTTWSGFGWVQVGLGYTSDSIRFRLFI